MGSRYPEFDDVGLAVEILHQLAEEALASEASSCCETVTPGTLPPDVGIERRDGDAGCRDAFNQLGGIGARPVREMMPSYFWPIAWLTKSWKRVVAVAEEGVHLEAQLASFLDGTRQNCGVVVGTEVADHRDAHRPLMLSDGSWHGGVFRCLQRAGQPAGWRASSEVLTFFIIIGSKSRETIPVKVC